MFWRVFQIGPDGKFSADRMLALFDKETKMPAERLAVAKNIVAMCRTEREWQRKRKHKPGNFLSFVF